MKTNFFLTISRDTYLHCDVIPSTTAYYPEKNTVSPFKNKAKLDWGMVLVDAPDSNRTTNDPQKFEVYFDTQENMMKFQLQNL